MTKLFKVPTKEEMTNSVAAFMPDGRIFAAKNQENTNLRKLLEAFSLEFFRMDETMNLISEDYDINATTELIGRWESAVGIPDDCLKGTGTLTERRRDVLAKFAMMNLTTEQDFIDLAALYGVVVTVTAGSIGNTYPMTFPYLLFESGKAARFTMIVDFDTVLETYPLTFPYTYGDATQGLIECLFNKSKPSNVQIIYT